MASMLSVKPVVARNSVVAPRASKVAPVAALPKESPIAGALMSIAASAIVLAAGPAEAVIRLPPIDNDPNRCERAFVGNTIGQANAVSDKVLDLRKCNLKGANLAQKTLSGAFMGEADFSNTNMQEAVLSKVYANNVNLDNTDLTNAILDRAVFSGSSMRNANFTNAVITGTLFDGVDLTDANFEDALVGGEDAKRLCANPTLKGESRVQVGCRQ